MTRMNAKTLTALVGAVALTTSAAAGVAPALADGAAQAPLTGDVQISGAAAPGGIVKAANVQGTFTFDQTVLSSTADISNVFSKAAAVLCTSMPEYGEARGEEPINVGGDVGQAYSATLSELADEEGTDAYDMACSCASNVPGGGAIANAEVEGVALASIADKAQAR